MTLVTQLALLILVVAVAVGLVALGVLVSQQLGKRLAQQSAEVRPRPVPPVPYEPAPVVVDPRPLGEAHVPFAGDELNPGEAWLSVGRLPVNARQIALVLAKLPVGTVFTGIEPDEVNGEGAMKLGFRHWSFARPNVERYPNGPRIWVSWQSETEPIVTWPMWDE